MRYLLLFGISFCQELYNEGARTFLVLEAIPIECYPTALWRSRKEELNEDGCLAQLAMDNNNHNIHLGELLTALEVELVGANIILFHIHEMIMDGIRNPSKYGESILFRTYLCNMEKHNFVKYSSDVRHTSLSIVICVMTFVLTVFKIFQFEKN